MAAEIVLFPYIAKNRKPILMRKILIIISAALVVLVADLAIMPSTRYVFKALIYQKPDIYDGDIFPKAVVASSGKGLDIPQSKILEKSLPDSLLKQLDLYRTTAFIVVKDSAVQYEHYFLDGGCDSLSNAFSATKSIVALLIGSAISDGAIHSVEDPISTYLPDLKGNELGAARISDLLSMSSGIKWDEGYSSLFAPVTRAYYGTDLRGQMLALTTKEAPGRTFEYQSCNTQLLAMVLESATHVGLAQYASQKLWKPLGAVRSAFWSLDAKDGMPKAYCCFYATARDFARVGLLVLNHGKSKSGETLVDSTYIARMVLPDTLLVDENGKRVNFYGYHWWLIRYKGHQVYYARGILGQYIFVVPSENMVVVRLGHERSKLRTEHHPNDIFSYLEAAFEIINH